MYHFVSIAAVVAYFVPLLLVLFKKAWKDPFFRLFGIYWSIGGFFNLIDFIPGATKAFSYQASVFYNMLDIPFILGILYYTSTYTLVKKTAAASIAVVIALSVISIISFGITYDAVKYPLGVGVVAVICMVAMEIVRYMQKVEHSTRQNAKMFIYGGLIFQYTTFIVIYIFDYIIETENRTDSYLIYYISSVIAMLIACCGFLMFRRYEMNQRSV